jgi:DNA-binding transcriptional LysR family regulator
MAASLTLAQLHTFVRLSELGTFARTAEEFGLTPPAVALQVRSLSDHFGLPLIEVVKRRPILTDAGRFLADRSRAVLDDVAALEREMSEFISARAGSLDIGATLTIGSYALAPLLARFEAAHPDAKISVHFANAARLGRYLKSRRINVALAVGTISDEDEAFETIPFGEDHLVLVVPAEGHRFSQRRSIRVEDLADERLVAREASSATRIVADRELAAHGVELATHLTVPSLEGVARAVEAGLGIAFLSWLVVERGVREGRLHVVDIRNVDLRRQFSLVTLKERALSPLAKRFVEFVKASTVPQYRRSRTPLKG